MVVLPSLLDQKLIYGAISKHLDEAFYELAKRKGVMIEEGRLIKDHVHICLSVPPKFAVTNVVGSLTGKSVISIAKSFRRRQRNFNGENFWARGCFVSTVGLDENMVLD